MGKTWRGLRCVALVMLAVVGCSLDSSEPSAESIAETDGSTAGATQGAVSTEASTTPESSAPATTAPQLENLEVVPAGPYREGQVVQLLAADDHVLDLYNQTPRLCASVDGQPESCDPDVLERVLLDEPPLGRQGVELALPQRHFGTSGYSDCHEESVSCWLEWVSNDGGRLTSPPLEYQAEATEPVAQIPVTVGAEPGVLLIDANGIPAGSDEQWLSDVVIRDIQNAFQGLEDPDLDEVTLRWGLSRFCAFGQGDPPIGSEKLSALPHWWGVKPENHRFSPADEPHPLQSTCDWSVGDWESPKLPADNPFELAIRRNIYGFAGWHDCARSGCFLEATLHWEHPIEEGGSIIGEIEHARAIVEVPGTWPMRRPSIRIVEPGPYVSGQTVTVEVEEPGEAPDGFLVAWCAPSCGYQVGESEILPDGTLVTRVKLHTRGNQGCISTCYLALDSSQEGLAPPAVHVVAVEGISED